DRGPFAAGRIPGSHASFTSVGQSAGPPSERAAGNYDGLLVAIVAAGCHGVESRHGIGGSEDLGSALYLLAPSGHARAVASPLAVAHRVEPAARRLHRHAQMLQNGLAGLAKRSDTGNI